MTTVEIHGQQVPVPKIEDGDTVLDIIILARAVAIQDNGEMGDAVRSATSSGTTFTTAIGTVQRHLWEMEQIARESLGWEDDE